MKDNYYTLQKIPKQPILNKAAIEFFQKGKQLFKENNIEEALKCFNEALKEDQMMLESQYLLGVCFLSFNQYSKAIEQFCDLLEKNENFKKNVFLLIAIAYKKTNEINAAIQIVKFFFIYLNINIIYKQLGKAIMQYPQYYDAYIYRGKLQVKMKRFEKAIQDFDIAIHLNPQCGLGYMGKGDCLRFSGQFSSAINLYTQALEKEEIIGQVAILKRAITYIEAKQYDNAKQDLQIILNQDNKNSEAYYFKGLLYYTQNNLNDAILCFEQAIKHNNSRKAVTKALYQIAKIKIELRDFYQAFHTITRAEFLDVDKKALEKFRIFTDGVTFLMKRKYQEGIENLSKLVKGYNLGDFLKPLVYTYRSYGYFCLGKHQKALLDLQTVENKLEKCSNYNKYICEGILSAQNNQFEQAMNFFNKANKLFSQKMEPFFYKAMTLVRFTNKLIPKTDEQKRIQYKQNALKNLDKGIELNDQNANIYFHRGVLRFSLNQINDSIQDFDKAIEKSEDNNAKHYYARGLAYACINCKKQAINDLSIAINLDQNYSNAYLNRAKCFHLIGDRNSAFVDLQKFVNIKPQDPDIHLWAGNLLFNIGAYEDAIKAYSHVNNISKNCDILLLRAKCYMVFKELNSALEDMEKIIELNQENLDIRFDQVCLMSLKIASQGSQEIEQISFFEQALEKIQQSKQFEKRSGAFFKRSDSLFFKGFYKFHLRDYEGALRKFKKSFEFKNQECKLKEQNLCELLEDDDEAVHISELEEYEFQNKTYNIYEYYYNCASCLIMMEKYQEAFKYLIQLQEILPEEEKVKCLEGLLLVLNDEIENKNTNNIFQKLLLNRIKILQFYYIIQQLFIFFKNFLYKQVTLYFCLPKVEAPSMIPFFDENLLQQLQPTVVENKPEAPWIRKTSEGIIFTDNVQHFEDLDLKTETKRESDEGKNDQVIEKNKLKDILKLDEDIEKKLAKLNRKI
ncbi:hypothetical protein IMG5_005100 [Ichthyophthirius multifiliis]|uniref:Tetratricopeptide repeat protein n=1 Tax=Ichthyophthirius multifiliis TaxID=5932 RepID=G0QJF7_ICHMU|nr:hypothetical protein IMG5_005100 [Ichthyophthirius multifiliis]EGR34644.1 hypothetical protein IMG5_005100 [Ichthyophthirius multifiliis]|eukprot:XP_004039948.1 hypothetical protein IMG5_005100 [Ichthyophthirius multifiliis]